MAEDLAAVPIIEHVAETVDGAVLGVAHTGAEEIRELLAEEIDAESIREYSVRLVSASRWEPTLGGVSVGIECIVCGKSVDSGGVSIDLGEDTYEVCCSSCATEIEAQYEELSGAAEGD